MILLMLKADSKSLSLKINIKAFNLLSKIPWFIFFLFTESSLATIQICNIKYGQKHLEQNEESLDIIRKIANEPLIRCKIIGVEHDQYKRPINTKPIYACCRDYQDNISE